jgi:hypothetical protein
MKIEFYHQFKKSPQKSNFMKIFQVRAESFHVDGRMDHWTEMLKLILVFHNFANVPSGENFG